MSISPARLLKAAEVAEYLGVTRQHVYNLMKRGLPSLRVGAARRFRIVDVVAWLESEQDTEVGDRS